VLEVTLLLAALVGFGLAGYLVTILTPHLVHNIGLLMLAAGLVGGLPTGFWYHVVLHRILGGRGALPARWWIHPTRFHSQLTPDEYRRVRVWFLLGGLGYTLAVGGGLAAIVGIIIDGM
jgi:hypothetical protein